MTMGRDFVKGIIKGSSDEARLIYGDVVLIKRLDSTSPGNPAQGISPTYTFITRKSRAVVSSMAQQDILNSGGLYQVGDIQVSLNENLEEVSDQTRGIGDRLIWRGNEYRIVGKIRNQNVNDRDAIYQYAMRKVE